MKINYTARYSVQGCILAGQTGHFECFTVQDETSPYPDIECYARDLTVCSKHHLAYCRLNITLTASNDFGNSTTVNFLSKHFITAGIYLFNYLLSTKPKFNEQFFKTIYSMTNFICSCRWSHITVSHMTSVLI